MGKGGFETSKREALITPGNVRSSDITLYHCYCEDAFEIRCCRWHRLLDRNRDLFHVHTKGQSSYDTDTVNTFSAVDDCAQL